MQPRPSSAPAAAALTDREIIDRVLGGEQAAFELLVRRHNQRLYRTARAIARSDADAEDALQVAWLNVYRHLRQYRGDAAFSTWATRIAANAAIAMTRRSPVVPAPPEPGAAEAEGEVNPDDAVERAQLGHLLERCLAGIPQGNREVMVLRDVLELDTAETAACLGLSEEAVRVRLHRARAAVAAVLSEKLADHARDVYGFDGARCDRVTAYVMCNVLGSAPL